MASTPALQSSDTEASQGSSPWIEAQLTWKADTEARLAETCAKKPFFGAIAFWDATYKPCAGKCRRSDAGAMLDLLDFCSCSAASLAGCLTAFKRQDQTRLQ